MTKEKPETLRRGEPETRTNYERAKDNFDQAKGESRTVTKLRTCPECGATMTITQTYTAPDAFHHVAVCSAHEEHNIDRYGFYSTDTETTP